MSFGLSSGGGQIRYAVLFDSTQAEQNVKRYQTSLQQLATGSTGLSSKMAIMNNTFSAGLNPIKNAGNAMNQLATTQKTLGGQLAGLGAAFKNNALAIGAAASSVLGLYQNYANLSSAQNAANKSATAAKAAQNSLTTAQNNLNKAVEKYGAGSKEAKQAQDKLTVAQERAINKTETAKIAQDNLNQTMADFGINILPNIVLAGGSIVSIFDNIGGKATGLTGAFTKMKGSLGSLSSSLGTSKLGFLGMAGAIGAAAIAAADLFDLLQKGAEIKVLNDIITAGKATTAQLEQQIKNIAEMKKRWDIQIFDFFKSGPIGKAALGDTFAHVGDEVIKSLESEISRIEAKKPLEKLFTMIANSSIPPSAKAGIQAQIKHLLAILDNPSNWQNPEFTKTSQGIVNNLISTLGSSIKSADVTTGLTGALRQMFVKVFKGVEFGNSPMTQLFAIDPKPIAASLDPIGKLYKATMDKVIASAKPGAEFTRLFGDKTELAKIAVTGLNAAVTNANPGMDSYNKAIQDGVDKFNDLVVSTELGAVTNRRYRDSLIQSVGAHIGFAKAAALSTADLELNQKAMSGDTDAAGQLAEKVKQLAQKFKALQDLRFNLGDMFKVKSEDDIQKKIDKLILKFLPKSVEKKIKLNLTFGTEQKLLLKRFNELVAEGTKLDEKTSEKIGQSIIDTIDASFKGKKTPKEFASLKKQISDAIADPNTPEALKTILANFDWTGTGEPIGGDLGGGIQTGLDKNPQVVPIDAPVIPKPDTTVFNTGAIKAVDVVAKRIADLSKIQATISLINKIAVKAVDVVAKRINDLTGIKPSISLQNKIAIKAVDVVAKRINDLSKIKPSINISNTEAFKRVDAVAKKIMSLENLHPTITVTVKQKSITAQHGFHGVLAEDTTIFAHKNERVDIGQATGGAVTRSSNGGGLGGGDTYISINVMDETIMRRITQRSGRNRFTMGI